MDLLNIGFIVPLKLDYYMLDLFPLFNLESI